MVFCFFDFWLFFLVVVLFLKIILFKLVMVVLLCVELGGVLGFKLCFCISEVFLVVLWVLLLFKVWIWMNVDFVVGWVCFVVFFDIFLNFVRMCWRLLFMFSVLKSIGLVLFVFFIIFCILNWEFWYCFIKVNVNFFCDNVSDNDEWKF